MIRDRQKIIDSLVPKYEAGASIRQLSAVHGHSYGTIRRLLGEGGVVLRPRGYPQKP